VQAPDVPLVSVNDHLVEPEDRFAERLVSRARQGGTAGGRQPPSERLGRLLGLGPGS